MGHKRNLIRDKIVEILKDASTIAGDNVYNSRTNRAFSSELPAIMVYSGNETNSPALEPTSKLNRSFELIIEIAKLQVSEIDNELDAFAAQIEAALPTKLGFSSVDAPIYSDLIETIYLQSSEVSLWAAGTQTAGAVQMIYKISYETSD